MNPHEISTPVTRDFFIAERNKVSDQRMVIDAIYIGLQQYREINSTDSWIDSPALRHLGKRQVAGVTVYVIDVENHWHVVARLPDSEPSSNQNHG